MRRTEFFSVECFEDQNSVDGQGFSLVHRDLQHIQKRKRAYICFPQSWNWKRKRTNPSREGMALGVVGRGRPKSWSTDIDEPIIG